MWLKLISQSFNLLIYLPIRVFSLIFISISLIFFLNSQLINLKKLNIKYYNENNQDSINIVFGRFVI